MSTKLAVHTAKRIAAYHGGFPRLRQRLGRPIFWTELEFSAGIGKMLKDGAKFNDIYWQFTSGLSDGLNKIKRLLGDDELAKSDAAFAFRLP